MTHNDDSQPLSIHDMPDVERPRERLWAYGAETLSNAELLAIILRTGSAQENVLRLAERLLSRFQGLHGLAQAMPAELMTIKGLGAAKIAQVVAALELGKRLTRFTPDERPVIQRAADAARLVSDMGSLTQEQVRVMFVDNTRRITGTSTIYQGTLNTSVVRVAEIFREAVARNSPAIIIAHNHPSGDPAPSPEDVELTRTLVSAGRLLDITVLDHLIIGRQGWTSLKDMGLMG